MLVGTGKNLAQSDAARNTKRSTEGCSLKSISPFGGIVLKEAQEKSMLLQGKLEETPKGIVLNVCW